MDTFDTRFKKIADAIRSLDEAGREDALGALELQYLEPDTGSLLTPDQIQEALRRLDGPQYLATDEEVRAVFAKYQLPQ